MSGIVSAGAVAASLTLAGPMILHGKQIAGMPTAKAADATAVKAERKAAVDAFMLASLEAEVRLSMQQYFDDPANSKGASFDVATVHLIKTGDSTYEGMATMSAVVPPVGQPLPSIVYLTRLEIVYQYRLES
ncbi:hypothetical protein [Mycobacterium sp. 155]|uniref:hypothetical protein n=1 Tax=Mycobacterium sp. 155 TaxID=1157943 RepID=UPI0003A4975F|nr:hypothetical protein [Mycobacterium sp. 155]